ncbi:patatin-like phospholipase family protein [Rhodoferax sp.]|uniref:patatin-like phospholipase family protein n=1 Tax=Rhodoferax sp. TaxID=50421 RepID=UPI0025D8C086|nr:patatin-like phospholipase family protein [Rhodoferax sp.]
MSQAGRTGRVLQAGWLGLALLLSACGSAPPLPKAEPAPVSAPAVKAKPVIGLVLGGGAAKGFAHIGVIKALEAQGIKPDLVIGTSAGSLIGALYASGKSGFELQALAIPLNEFQVSDWVLPDRGMIKGEALAKFVNTAVGNRPLEKLPRKFGVVATDLASGEPIVFRSGDTGTAVRASSSVPGVFQPVSIRGREYVDGGLSSPVPVRFAREMGATFVIAVDISDKPLNSKLKSTFDILMQSVTIMGQTIARHELPLADVVIRPDIAQLEVLDFTTRHVAVLEGEKAVARVMPALRDKLARFGQPPTTPATMP